MHYAQVLYKVFKILTACLHASFLTGKMLYAIRTLENTIRKRNSHYKSFGLDILRKQFMFRYQSEMNALQFKFLYITLLIVSNDLKFGILSNVYDCLISFENKGILSNNKIY